MSQVRERARTGTRSARNGHRRGTGARWRVASRLARRQVARTRLSSLLVVALVALPIAGMAGFAVWSASSVGTPDERARIELGATEAWVQPVGIPDAGFWQLPDQPDWNGYPVKSAGGADVEGEPVADPTTVLPAGTETIEVFEGGSIRVDTAAGSTAIPASFGDTWDPAFTGRYDLVDGRTPVGASEAMVTPASLPRLGIGIGDRVTLSDPRAQYTVVGTLDAAGQADTDPGIFLPLDDTTAHLASGQHRWYVPERPLPWSEVSELNEAGVVALSRAVLLDPPTVTGEDQVRAQQSRSIGVWSTVMVIAVGGAFAAYVVVMLAGAAFAVAARRQQRALAIVASAGATRRDLFRVVVLQGTVLGAVGGLGGVGIGVGSAAGILVITDDGSGMRPWGLHIPWSGLAAIAVFAVVVGTLSALVPARGAARADAINALRGSRRPQRPTAARPIWGSLLLVAGAALTIASALVEAAMSDSPIPGDSPLRWLPIWGIVAGPIVAQIGILLSGRWLLWTTSRLLSRASTAARIASRDAAANAARTVPAFAAIGATVFLGVFVAAASSMGTAHTVRTWYYTAPVGSLTISAWATGSGTTAPDPLTEEQRTDAMTQARSLAEDAGASAVAVVARQPMAWDHPDPDDIPADGEMTIAVLPEKHLLDSNVEDSFTSRGSDPQNNLAVVAPEDLATALGLDVSASELAAYRSGTALVLDERYVTDGTIEVATWTLADAYNGRTPDNVWLPQPETPSIADPLRSERVDAIVVDTAVPLTGIALAPRTAEELGIRALPERVVASFDEPLAVDQLDRLMDQASLPRDGYALSPHVEQGPPSSLTWLIPLLAVVSVLVVGASAVALGLARFERRPDDATLAAVGGTRGLRRRIGFWQGLLIAGFGTMAGAVAGLLPALGLSVQSPDTQRLGDIPWVILGSLAVVLPLGIALVNMLVPPRRPDLTRRNVIA